MDDAERTQAEQSRRFRTVDRLFRESVRLADAEREAFLREACDGDEGLRREVEALLAEDTDPLIATFGWSAEGGAGAGIAEGHPPAPEIPGFTIGRVLGVGGMGIVYEAEQHRPKRRVALKVLRPGLHSPERLRRFEAEGEFLARLTHPGIAQIHDAGATSDQRPYFAMEFIDGRPITEHASSLALPTRERLRLFLQVCDAVQFAHQNAVIHRDLKPSNILVIGGMGDTTTATGLGPGIVKVLDFGIARAADTDLQAVTVHTDTGQLLGTLPYMSPEQASGDPTLIDTRTDIYSLGLLLFELLTEQRPRRLDELAFADAIQAIRFSEPTRLGSINRALRGDLETIVGKALERERERRYPTISEMADDIRRHLQSEPITARPPSTLYQVGKFARRHRALVGAVATVIVVLGVALTAVSIALGKASAALDESRRQTRIANAVNEFLNVDLLGAASPDAFALERDVTVREAVDRAAERIGHRFDDEPLVEASIRYSIATAYFNLGRYDLAEDQARRALTLYTTGAGPEDADSLDALNLLAFSLFYSDQLEAARPVFQTLVEAQRRVRGSDDARTIESITGLADLHANLGAFEKAEPLLAEVVESGTKKHGPKSDEVLYTLDSLGQLQYRMKHYEDAENTFRRVLAIRDEVQGESHSDTLSTLSSLALTLQRRGSLDESLELSVRSVEAHEHVMGPTHPDTQTVRTNLGLLYIAMGRHDDAETIIRDVLDLRLATIGELSSDTLVSKAMLARALRERGDPTRFEEAAQLALDAAEGFEELRGPDHPYTHIAIDGLAQIYEVMGRDADAALWRAKLPAAQQGQASE